MIEFYMEYLDVIKMFIFGGFIFWLFASDTDKQKEQSQAVEFRTISTDFGWVKNMFKTIWVLILFIIFIACVVCGIASFFAMLASIIHFQILGAMGYLVLFILCYGVGSWTIMHLRYGVGE
jgi:uncharacterized membrane protein YgcG